jgi:predicted porin
MNKKLSMAVAGAVMAMGASAANAGITIPAGDWTIDIGGNVNAFYTHSQVDIKGGADPEDSNTIGTGLLPAALGIGGKSRQNDLDVAFQFTFFTGTSSGSGGLLGTDDGSGAQGNALSGNTLNIRQAFMTFGDKSWGTIKLGRDLGIFGSDAILSDMTLLGVGLGAPGGSSTLGRIGNGYVYADWKGQISYASPNWNGFSFAAGIMEGWGNNQSGHDKNNLGYEAKASYEWAGDMAGKVWVGALSQKHEGDTLPDEYTSSAWEIGAKASIGPVALVGYYYDGKGLDSAWQDPSSGVAGGLPGLQFQAGEETDDSGGYIQGVFTAPTGTKIGLSWGKNESESDVSGSWESQTESWMLGVYHPLTKSVNLVAEYTDAEIEGVAGSDSTEFDIKQFSLGAIMFF